MKKNKKFTAKIKKGGVRKQYYSFVEHNDWEGETWTFYLNLTPIEHNKLKVMLDKIGESEYDAYILSDKPISEDKVDILVNGATDGYMASHNKISNPIIPKKIKKGEDPFYKGSQWDK